MKIAIIGAGAAGLEALRHCLDEKHDCVAFEQTDNIGGTWNYTENTEFDQHGIPVHSSMYKGLKTNLPKELMEYREFKYEENEKSFITQEEVLSYMEKFADNFRLRQYIKSFKRILEVTPIFGGKWSIKIEDVRTKRIETSTSDVVIVCTGNYWNPKYPKTKGVEDFEGRKIHSHSYRVPEPYENRRVLVVGAGPSGVDISRILSNCAEKVFLSFDTTVFHGVPDNVLAKPRASLYRKNSVLFEDGTEEIIDDVIFCTGYEYSYPFLNEKCGISIENNWVKPLYKHIVNIEHPTMGFIGIPFKVCPFPCFGIQIRFYLALLNGHFTISKEEMLTDLQNDKNRRAEMGVQPHHAHKIGVEMQGVYFEDLAQTARIEKMPTVIQKLYESLCNDRNIHKRYKIVSDDEFVEVT